MGIHKDQNHLPVNQPLRLAIRDEPGAGRSRPDLHELVDTAVSIARAHPDGYIRHRVTHQVAD